MDYKSKDIRLEIYYKMGDTIEPIDTIAYSLSF